VKARKWVFEIPEEERPRAEAFIREHRELHREEARRSTVAIATSFTYSFSPSSVGMLVSIHCNFCKTSTDVSGNL